jgi:hypothetical protein
MPWLVAEAMRLDRQRIAGEDGLRWTPQFRDIESLWRMSERVGERAALAFFASNLHEQAQACPITGRRSFSVCIRCGLWSARGLSDPGQIEIHSRTVYLDSDALLGSRAAIAAGADGVEIHGANGYLLHQFLASNANQRTDRYGGSIENRIRFAVEVASAVADEVGAGRTGIRISPGNPFNDIVEHDVADIYGAPIPALGRLELAYLHLTHGADEDLAWAIRRDWPSALLLNRPGSDIRVRAQDVRGGLADVITVSSMTLANPDLVERIKVGALLNTPDPRTFYGWDERSYTDYPTLQPAIA